MAIPALQATNIKDALQSVLDENERLKAQAEQKGKLLEELRAEGAEAKVTLKRLEPYLDILEDDETQWVTIALRNPVIWKQLRVKTRQVFGSLGGDTNQNLTKMVEACLSDSLFVNWPSIKRRQFGERQET